MSIVQSRIRQSIFGDDSEPLRVPFQFYFVQEFKILCVWIRNPFGKFEGIEDPTYYGSKSLTDQSRKWRTADATSWHQCDDQVYHGRSHNKPDNSAECDPIDVEEINEKPGKEEEQGKMH